MSEVALSPATRANLYSLQQTQILVDRTQQRLSTSLKVNSALDDAVAFFTARNLSARASDLQTVKNAIGEGVSIVTAATQGLQSIESVLTQMKALAQSAISASDSTTRAKLASQFNELRSQIDGIAADSSFDGVNLLKNTTGKFVGGADQLTVKFNERTESSSIQQLVVNGLSAADFKTIVATSATSTGAAGTTTVWGQTGTAAVKAINSAISAIDSALSTVRTASQSFGSNASLLAIRSNFTSNLINTLSNGASSLVNADLNEESANLLALQTRQQLGTIALSIAQRSEQSILRLF